MQHFDAVIVGAGAAGLFCAGVAGQAGLRILVLDHSEKVAEKIRISGGGRSNFTNRQVHADNFISANPRFARSALHGYTPDDFLALVKRYGIAFHEKHKGQLFCDRSAEDLIDMLLAECGCGAVTRWQGCRVGNIRYSDAALANAAAHSRQAGHYELDTAQGTVSCNALVIATGGLSIPQIGASDFGYRVARQFGLALVPTRPALVPLTFDAQAWAPYAKLSGLSLPVLIANGTRKDSVRFREDLLLTHQGLSGPGVLQISSYWQDGGSLYVNLLPELDVLQHLQQVKATSRKRLSNELANLLPTRLAETWIEHGSALGHDWLRAANETSDRALQALAEQLTRWELRPTGTAGYRKAEVTGGGVDTRALSSKTMESTQPGLYFIGEVVDVTGWLGGYNFQWAWASGYACAQALADRLRGAG